MLRTVSEKCYKDYLPKRAQYGRDVCVHESKIPQAGLGLFAMREFQKGEVVCFFHGRSVNTKDMNLLAPELQERYSQYMMMTPSSDHACVPLRKDGSVPLLPPRYAGCLINEADSTRKPNVLVILPAEYEKLVSIGCPFFGRNTRIMDWPFLALRRIRKGEELLTCYGSSYEGRNYKVSPHCKSCH